MPDLIKLYIRSAAIGFGLSAVFAGLMLWLDVLGLRGLVMGSSDGFLALFVMWVLNRIVFGSVQFGIAIMSMASDDEVDDDDRGGPPIGRIIEDRVAIPVRVDKPGANRGTRR